MKQISTRRGFPGIIKGITLTLSTLFLLVLQFQGQAQTLSLGNQVYIDNNRSATFDAGDDFVTNAIVRLYLDANNDNTPDGTFIQATSTNALGQYSFTGLTAGNYIVGVVIPSGLTIMYANGGDPDNNTEDDNNAVSVVSGEARGFAITLSAGGEPGGNVNNTYDFAFYNPALPPTGGAVCFTSTNPVVWAKSYWTANVNQNTVTIRTTFAKTFVDNTYGTTAIGWPNGHTFANLVGSDNLTWNLKDANGNVVLSFQQDYISLDATRPSGYGCTGFNDDGNPPTIGNTTDVISFRTSMDVNFNTFGYSSYTTNSPATNANYAKNPATPNWIYDVWYEITVKKSIFGTAGFGFPEVASVHASPSKTGNNTETVTKTTCYESELGDFVWNDLNANGIQDSGEPGIPGVAVKLTKPDNSIVTTTTDANGGYKFTTLGPGNYTVTFTTPNNFIPTPSKQGSNSSVDSDPINGVVAVTLGNLEKNYTIDAGFTSPLSLGDFVWEDFNNNGVQDSGEPGISGVTVKLYADADGNNIPDGAATQTTTTDATGKYKFANLIPGKYIVGVTPPAGYGSSATTATSANPDNDDNTDNNGVNTVSGEVRSNFITLSINGEPTNDGDDNNGNTTLDFGLRGKGVIGDYVWYDQNNNGIQNAGETGLANITVNLYRDNDGNNIPDGAAIKTTTTDANGKYSFDGLATGKYIVSVIAPAGYGPSFTTASSLLPDNDDNTDNNGITIIGNEIRSNFLTLSPGSEPTTDGDDNNGNLTLDFGLKGAGFIGDFVWNDLNFNGVQDPGEPGIAGATVTLTFPNGSTTSMVTTSTGYYGFTDLIPGTYSVAFTTPVNFTASPSKVGGDDNKDSDPINGVVSGITLGIGQFITTVDAGFYKPVGSIGDRVWNDLNRNGIQDLDEVGVSTITVSLYDATNALIATTVTDGLGNYLFSNLPILTAGSDYQVRFSIAPEYQFSPQSQGGNLSTDSDPDVLTGRTGTVTLTFANRDRSDIDAGIYYSIPARIGDFIWNDLNKNGVQDPNEPGIAGVTLTLYQNGVPVATTITDNNGYYVFNDVPAGSNYTLGVSLPVGYILSNKDQGGDDAKDSDFDPSTLLTAPFTVTAGTINLTYDGGMQVTSVTKAAVGDRVWNDLNNNGLQDAGEPGIAGVTVQLLASPANTLVASMVTDAFGMYMFNNLVPGTYYIRFLNTPAGYTIVTQNAGGLPNVAIDSDPDVITGITPNFTLVADQTLVTIDAGLRNTATSNNSSIGDFVWYDANRNGIQDAGEAGVPGVTVVLFNATTNAIIKTTTTDAYGSYTFTDLPNGSYVIGFTNIPAGYVFTAKDVTTESLGTDSDPDPASGRTGTYSIFVAGTYIKTVDAGIVSEQNVRDSKATIGDKVWNDVNGNNLQDAGEPGVPGVTVTLFAANGTTVIATTTTDGLGNYLFTNLDAGTYVVGFSGLPSGYVFATPNTGSDRSKDSDPNVSTGKTAPILLAAGEVNLTIDAGVKASTPKSAIGDKVWFDYNGNGIQDVAETAGVPGVTVTLYNTSGTPVKVTATDVNGLYLFTDLDAGTYTVGFSNLPRGYVPTTQNASGSTAANNSDADVTTGRTGNITIAAGTTDLTWDMGIVSTTRAAVGDYVWSDKNGNGIQDANEAPVGGITVTLYNDANLPISSAVTDGTGYYLFSNLPAGTYTIGFSNLPVNTSFTTKNASGSTAANNSDPNPSTGKTDAFTLTAGQVRTDIDAGLIPNFAAVGDYVWYDVNVDGIQQSTEIGVPGVTVTLYDASNNKVASAVTDGKGRYFINNIPVNAGGSSFTVGFSDLPITSPTFTIKNAPGSTSSNNSDANPASGKTDAFTLNPGQVRLDIDAGLITENGGLLPIRLVALKGNYSNGVSNLTWSTESEQNFSHFEVEFSKDGVTFTKLGNVAGAGNSNTMRNYSFGHTQPVNGANYYRLKMVDNDGTFTYSNVVLLNVTRKGIHIVNVYPNPFIDKVNLSVTSEKAQNVSVSMYNNAGQLVINKNVAVVAGNNIVTLDRLPHLAAGNYIFKVTTADEVFTQKLVK